MHNGLALSGLRVESRRLLVEYPIVRHELISRKRRTLILLIMPIFLILANCDTYPSGTPQLHPSEEPSINSPPIQTIMPLPTVTQEIPPYLIPTFEPTIPPEQEQLLVDLLHKTDCNLPCYLGIIPGKTSWEKADSILKNLGAIPSGSQYDKKGFLVYGYSITLGDPRASDITPDPNFSIGNIRIYHRLGLTVIDDIVHQINVSVRTNMAKKSLEYWSRYSLAQLMQQMGSPDKIYFSGFREGSTGYSMFILYINQGIGLYVSAIKEGNTVCPLVLKDTQPGFSLTSTNPLVISEINPPGAVPATNREVYLPITETLGIEAIAFYERLISDPSTCFEIMEAS